jgi:hypothetical protein
LLDDQVVVHQFVIGELAVGSLSRRAEILGLLDALPAAPVAAYQEVLTLVETHDLAGTGLGWVEKPRTSGSISRWR